MSTLLDAHDALDWVVRNFATRRILRRRSVPWMSLCYESFARRPAESLDRVLAFLGEEGAGSPIVGSSAVISRRGHAVGGNRRVKRQLGSIEVREDDAWRTELPRTDHVLVSALTWPARSIWARRTSGSAGRSR